ncbi:MAG: hypothetical protein ACRDGR_07550, partial [bacterium]
NVPAAAAATSDLHPSELVDRVDIPRMDIGQPVREVLFDLTNLSGAAPDPEADSVQRGRRLVEPIEAELSGAYDTPEELAQVVLDGISIGDAGLLHDQRVTKREFAEIFWPEFPQSRPETNIQSHDAWMFHDAECHDGVKEALHRWGGTELRLQTIRWEKGIAQYANFNLYHGVVLEAVTDRGELVEVEIAPLFAERNGRWKVYMYAS